MPCSASSSARMSSTGFFHSRFCGTVADAGCWAFLVGAFVIHPPNETQLQAESVLVAAFGSNYCYWKVRCRNSSAFVALSRSSLFTTRTRQQNRGPMQNKRCAYTIVEAIQGTVNSILCETHG